MACLTDAFHRSNFNQERLGIVYQALRFARVCLEESFLYAHSRKTFGKRLIDHPVIRAKLAEMARHVEATQAMSDNLTYQTTRLPREHAMLLLGGDTALLKVQATRTFELCAREAAQIFGGNSYVRGGRGEKIERLYREVRACGCPPLPLASGSFTLMRAPWPLRRCDSGWQRGSHV